MLNDDKYILRAIQLSKMALAKGESPYGSLLVDEFGNILIESHNSQIESNDISAHSELNVIKEAVRKYDTNFLKKCTLYNSGEPCSMCSGAIYFSKINRVVFAISKADVDKIYNIKNNIKVDIHQLFVDIKGVEIVGPLTKFSEIAGDVHIEFRDKNKN